MPTGNTQDIYEGKDITFREYAMKCARAFGSYITFRDDPMDMKLPTKLEPSTYYRDELDKAASRIQELIIMTPSQKEAAAQERHHKDMERWKESEQKNYVLSIRYDAMIEEALKFVAPTPDHESFAKFLVDQLEESKKFDCHTPGQKYYTEPVKESGDEWYSRELEKATKNVKYYSEEWEKELKRTKENNEWISNLLTSLDKMEKKNEPVRI